MSLTNTADPRKHMYYPKFEWPRVVNPKLRFPITDETLVETIAAERQAVEQIEEAVRANPDDIAALIIEPMQGEGGDNHFRPEFFARLRRFADENEFLFIVDEVQTGVGTTGKMWAIDHDGRCRTSSRSARRRRSAASSPARASTRSPDNVFHVASRINSTWGGNLIDMVRSQRFIEIIEKTVWWKTRRRWVSSCWTA